MRLAATLALALAAGATAMADVGRLRVVLPEDAQLIVNDQVSRNHSGERVIESQDLEEGEDYFYELEASAERNGKLYTERKTVSISAGYETKVTFSFPEERPAERTRSYSSGRGTSGGTSRGTGYSASRGASRTAGNSASGRGSSGGAYRSPQSFAGGQGQWAGGNGLAFGGGQSGGGYRGNPLSNGGGNGGGGQARPVTPQQIRAMQMRQQIQNGIRNFFGRP